MSDTETPGEILQLFQRAILKDRGVLFQQATRQEDDDGWVRYAIDLTEVPGARESQLEIVHLTIAKRLRDVPTDNLPRYLKAVTAAWAELTKEIGTRSYA